MTRLASLRFIGLILFVIIITFTVHLPVGYAATTIATCDEANLDAALATGGLINFSCSGTIIITTTKGITIDTTIDGSGQNVVLDGGGLFVRLFSINSGFTLELDNLTLTRGDGTVGGGGLISNQFVLIANNVTFSNSFAGGGQSGGAISNPGVIYINNSTFTGNTALAGGGGAIVNSGTLNITNSTFSGNQAAIGGAIANASGGTTNITNTTFTNNQANYGAAVYNSGLGNPTTTIINSTFVDNTAINGGSIYNLNTVSTAGSTYINGDCFGTINDGGGNGAFNAPGCPGVPVTPPAPTAPNQCQETRDPAYAAPVGWYCQVLMRNNAWVGYPGTIPSQLTDAGVIIAVDLIYYDYAGHAAEQVDGQHQVCLQGQGRFIFLSAAQSPRQIVEVNSVYQDGYTCAWIDTSGTAVLIHN